MAVGSQGEATIDILFLFAKNAIFMCRYIWPFKMKNLINYIFLISSLAFGSVIAAPMSNEDVIVLKNHGMDEKLILEAISASEPNFDISSPALIRLKESGVSDKIIIKIISSKHSKIPLNASVAEERSCREFSEGKIKIFNSNISFLQGYKRGKKETQSSGSGRFLASMATFGIVKMHKVNHYSFLVGEKSKVRFLENEPIYFQGLMIERGHDPEEAIKLVSFEEGESEEFLGRVLPIGEGSVSYWGSASGTLSHAPAKTHIKEIKFDRNVEECVYGAKPVNLWAAMRENPLPPGEYAIFVEPDRYYDFAVDAVAPEK